MSKQLQVRQLPCSTQIDYSTVQTGGKKFPFIIELDLTASVLEPQPGQNQKFCYRITGVGEDLPDFADISHFVFSICPEITAEDIADIKVLIDGVAQPVNFQEGGNVELRSQTKPDPKTGCPGLKFDFSVSKVLSSQGSLVSVCFELKPVYAIGDIAVCLFGGNTAAPARTICGPVCALPPAECDVTVFQRSSVCVPVTVTPYAEPGTVTTICCGSPLITPYMGSCHGTAAQCTFTVTQEVCITIPITFGASAHVGEAAIQCEEPSLANVCENCD